MQKQCFHGGFLNHHKQRWGIRIGNYDVRGLNHLPLPQSRLEATAVCHETKTQNWKHTLPFLTMHTLKSGTRCPSSGREHVFSARTELTVLKHNTLGSTLSSFQQAIEGWGMCVCVFLNCCYCWTVRGVRSPRNYSKSLQQIQIDLLPTSNHANAMSGTVFVEVWLLPATCSHFQANKNLKLIFCSPGVLLKFFFPPDCFPTF